MAKATEVKTVNLRNINSGALVSVVEEKVARMGSEWEPVTKTAAKKSAASDSK